MEKKKIPICKEVEVYFRKFKVLACPFCGEVPIAWRSDYGYVYLGCRTDHYTMKCPGWYMNHSEPANRAHELIARWNKRPQSIHPPAEGTVGIYLSEEEDTQREYN